VIDLAQPRYHPFLQEMLLCLECRSPDTSFLPNDGESVVCEACGYRYPIISGVLAAFSQEGQSMVHYSEIKPEYRTAFFKGKEFSYERGWGFSSLYNHYHRFAAQERQKSRAEGFFLDLGCGIGEHLPFVTPEERPYYIGLDLDRYKLEYFQAQHPDIFLIQCDAHNLPLKSQCTSYVQTTALLEYFDEQGLTAVLSEVRRVLRSEGVYVNCMPAEGGFLFKGSKMLINVLQKWLLAESMDNMVDAIRSDALTIKEHLAEHFWLKTRWYFPTVVPSLHCNWFLNEVYQPLPPTDLGKE